MAIEGAFHTALQLPAPRSLPARQGGPRLFAQPHTWAVLRETVFPRLVATRRVAPVRVWCTGPAAIEDAHSALISFADLMDEAAVAGRVRVFATLPPGTDLQVTRHAWHPSDGLDALSEPQVRRCFERRGDRYALRPELREALFIGRHDPLTQAPLSRIDLVFCRGVLSGLCATKAPLVLSRLHFALGAQGWLVVGDDDLEGLAGHGLFRAVAAGAPVLRKRGRASVRSLLPLATVRPGRPDERTAPDLAGARSGTVLLDPHGALLWADSEASEMLALRARGEGAHPTADWLGLGAESALARAARDARRSAHLIGVECPTGTGQVSRFDLEVVPHQASQRGASAVLVRLRDARPALGGWRLSEAYERLEHEAEALRASEEEMRAGYEDLERAHADLQVAHREVAASNVALVRDQRAAREELAQVRAALNVIPQAVLVVTADGTVAASNVAAAVRFGWPNELITHQMLSVLLGPHEGPDSGRKCMRFRQVGRASLPASSGLALGRRVDGSTFPIELELTTRTDGRGQVVALVLWERGPERPAAAAEGMCAPEPVGEAPSLTRRELQVMRLLVEGRQSKEVARCLGISRRTVDVHRARIMRKTGMRSIADLVRLAISHQLIE